MKLQNLTLLLIAATVANLTGCANESGARMGLFSATAPVIAILQDDLFVGEATGYLDRTGVINVQSSVNTSIKCIGEFRYTGSKSGVAHLRCNDGNEAQLTFNSLSSLSGYGYGKTTRGPGSFTFGLTPEQASKYLTLPAGKKLNEKSEKLLLDNI
jgi:hypothetical protein